MQPAWRRNFSILFMRGISWIFPRIAASQALKLFLTPTLIPRPLSEVEYYKTAKKYKILPGLAAYEWGDPEGSLALLVHGWNGRGTQMGPFVAPLVQKGFRVIAIDGPAHGESEGATTNVGAYANAMVQVQQILGPIDVVIAHSMGAGCIVVALSRGMLAKQIVLIAGPARYELIVQDFFNAVRISPFAQKDFIKLLTNRVGLSPSQLNIADMISQQKVPALLIHDTEDKEVPFTAAVEIKNAWPEIEFLKTSGLGHRRILKDSKVIEEVSRFIESGTDLRKNNP